jgi:hypothetical protein
MLDAAEQRHLPGCSAADPTIARCGWLLEPRLWTESGATLPVWLAKRARIISVSAKGTVVKPSKHTLEEEIGGWHECRRPDVKPTTFTFYVRALKPARHQYGALALQQLTDVHVARLRLATWRPARSARCEVVANQLAPR